MRTPEQYIESLRELSLNLWIDGVHVPHAVDHPKVRPSPKVLTPRSLHQVGQFNSTIFCPHASAP